MGPSVISREHTWLQMMAMTMVRRSGNVMADVVVVVIVDGRPVTDRKISTIMINCNIMSSDVND